MTKETAILGLLAEQQITIYTLRAEIQQLRKQLEEQQQDHQPDQ